MIRRALLIALATSTMTAEAAVTYRTIDVAATVGHGNNTVEGFIRGDATGTDLSSFSMPPAFANPSGALSSTFVDLSLPLGQPNSYLWVYQSGTAVWDDFVVSGDPVRVRDIDLNLNEVRTDGSLLRHTSDPSRSLKMTDNLDGTATIEYTVDVKYLSGPHPGVGSHTRVDTKARGAYVINDTSSGLATATAAQFPILGQLGADYLNGVIANHLAGTAWTQAGSWLYGDNYTADNTRGFFEDDLIGGSFLGYNVWYTTDAFVFTQPLPEADGDGLFSNTEVDALIAGSFPEVAGLNLAGNGLAQLYDVDVVEGDNSVQTLVFDYDDTILAPGEEELLSIVHYVNGEWVTHDQVSIRSRTRSRLRSVASHRLPWSPSRCRLPC